MYLLQLVKPFLETKTYNKVKFVYTDDLNTKKVMEDLFDIEKLEAAFGGNDTGGFDINKYAERMKEDDKKMPLVASHPVVTSAALSLDPIKLDSSSDNEKTDASDNEKTDASDNEKTDGSLSHGIEPEIVSDRNMPVASSTRNATDVVEQE